MDVDLYLLKTQGKYSSLGFYNDYLSGGVFHFINIDDAVIFIYAFSKKVHEILFSVKTVFVCFYGGKLNAVFPGIFSRSRSGIPLSCSTVW